MIKRTRVRFSPGRRLLKNSQLKNIKKHNLGVDFLKVLCYNYIVIKRKEKQINGKNNYTRLRNNKLTR